MKKTMILCAIIILLAITLSACGGTEADKVNQNLNLQSEYFECERKITVYNARTDTIILECEGYMNLDNNKYGELVVTVKTSPTTYKKNYIYLNDYTLYVMEDITGTHTDPYHYKMYFHTNILPSVEIKP